MEYDIVEFIVNNKDDINSHLECELQPTLIASRIFDGHPDLQQDIIDEKTTAALIHYLQPHFPELNYLDLASVITPSSIKQLL